VARENIAPSGSPLFADKGSARPASGLRSIYPDAEHDDDPQVPVVPVKSPDPALRAVEPDELAEAASLQAGGFKTAVLEEPAPPTPDAAEPEIAEVFPEIPETSTATAGPAEIETALAEADRPSTEGSAAQTTGLIARIGALHPLVIGGAFAALLIASLVIGYGVSVVAGAGSAGESAVAPADATRSDTPRPSDGTAR
jgi:poly-gamma-glutamate capsule biosynthesis protein CapA/YwtB (metallophosphatase superfamily)